MDHLKFANASNVKTNLKLNGIKLLDCKVTTHFLEPTLLFGFCLPIQAGRKEGHTKHTHSHTSLFERCLHWQISKDLSSNGSSLALVLMWRAAAFKPKDFLDFQGHDAELLPQRRPRSSLVIIVEFHSESDGIRKVFYHS